MSKDKTFFSQLVISNLKLIDNLLENDKFFSDLVILETRFCLHMKSFVDTLKLQRRHDKISLECFIDEVILLSKLRQIKSLPIRC